MSINQRPPDWTDKTWLAWCAILNLSPEELMALKKHLIDTFGPEQEGGAGVREPRKPLLPLDGFGMALELPTGDVGSGLSAST